VDWLVLRFKEDKMIRKGPTILLFAIIPMLYLVYYLNSTGTPQSTIVLIIAPLLAAAIFGYYFIVKPDLEAQRILKIGEPAEATILETSHTSATGKKQGSYPVRFVLEVRPPGKPAYKAKAFAHILKRALGQFQAGKVLKVKYDPKDMQKVALVPVPK